MVAIFLWGIAGYFVARMLLSKSFRCCGTGRGLWRWGVALPGPLRVVGFDLTGFETRGAPGPGRGQRLHPGPSGPAL